MFVRDVWGCGLVSGWVCQDGCTSHYCFSFTGMWLSDKIEAHYHNVCLERTIQVLQDTVPCELLNHPSLNTTLASSQVMVEGKASQYCAVTGGRTSVVALTTWKHRTQQTHREWLIAFFLEENPFHTETKSLFCFSNSMTVLLCISRDPFWEDGASLAHTQQLHPAPGFWRSRAGLTEHNHDAFKAGTADGPFHSIMQSRLLSKRLVFLFITWLNGTGWRHYFTVTKQSFHWEVYQECILFVMIYWICHK